MSQSELCVITCDDCEKTITAEDWDEAHDTARESGWSVTATEDYCEDCK